MENKLQALLEFLKDNGYRDLKVLPDDVIVGTLDLMFTRGLVIDLDWEGWGKRYCYEDREQATLACNTLQSGDDEPMVGYVASRSRL
jgi:hypothetical protein